MPRYLVTYHGSGAPSPDQQQEAMAAFGAWLASAGPAVIDPGAPLSVSKSVSSAGVSAEPVAPIGGYTLLEAADLPAAVKLVENHPFIARGGTLQVSEAVNIAG
jgi:hypothetical protein